MTRLPSPPWLTAPATVAVLDALEAVGGADCARFVGGAVRNALMDRPVDDIDIATTLTPDQVIAALKAAGLKSVPTGIEHGTVTAISGRQPFEITTLRRDVSTDGRRATVAFTDNWKEDAERRDFRLNALYANREGEVFDPVGGGIEDCEFGRIIFVGDPEARIREDYLRILRFFRFFAWYGRGDADGPALAACAKLKDGIKQLSSERITKEVLKLFAAPDPRPSLRLATRCGVATEVLPGPLNRNRYFSLIGLQDEPDALLRLSAVLPDDAAGRVHATSRLRLSNAETARIMSVLDTSAEVRLDLPHREARAAIYRLGAAVFKDRVYLRWAEQPDHSEAARALVALAGTWTPPKFPVGGKEAIDAGLSGPAVGQALRAVEDWWVAQDFPAGGALERLHQMAIGQGA